MLHVKKICLSCRYYRLRDELSGICRVNKEGKGKYPLKRNDDSCEKWSDCGQQYYIRTGWIKATKNKDSSEPLN